MTNNIKHWWAHQLTHLPSGSKSNHLAAIDARIKEINSSTTEITGITEYPRYQRCCLEQVSKCPFRMNSQQEVWSSRDLRHSIMSSLWISWFDCRYKWRCVHETGMSTENDECSKFNIRDGYPWIPHILQKPGHIHWMWILWRRIPCPLQPWLGTSLAHTT